MANEGNYYALDRNVELLLQNGYPHLFSALRNLPLDFLRYQHIFTAIALKCLEPISLDALDKKTLKQLGFTVQTLWTISSVAHTQFPEDQKLNAIFTRANELIASLPAETSGTGSATQIALTAKIGELLSSDAKSELQTEHALGIYHLDIALPAKQLAIEIDGKQHYENRRLKCSNILRDFIVEHIFGWHTVRLPYFEYGHALHYGVIQAYLLHKLSSYSSLPNADGKSLQKASHTWSSCFFKPKTKKIQLERKKIEPAEQHSLDKAVTP